MEINFCIICNNPTERKRPKEIKEDYDNFSSISNLLNFSTSLTKEQEERIRSNFKEVKEQKLPLNCRSCQNLIKNGVAFINEIIYLQEKLQKIKEKLKEEFHQSVKNDSNIHGPKSLREIRDSLIQNLNLIEASSSKTFKEVEEDLNTREEVIFEGADADFDDDETMYTFSIKNGSPEMANINDDNLKTDESENNFTTQNFIKNEAEAETTENMDNVGDGDAVSDTNSDFSAAKKNKKRKKKKMKIKIKSENNEEEEIYNCSVCNKNFNKKYKLNYHYQRVHKQEKRYICSTCNDNEGFATSEKLNYHVAKKHPEFAKFRCDVCGMGWTTKTLLTKHERKHFDEKNFKCHICRMAYKNPNTLKIHIDATHFGTRNATLCDLCGKNFLCASTLKAHKTNVHERSMDFPCEEEDCNFVTNTKALLKSHKLIVHLKEKSYICHICGAGYYKKYNLTQHERIHTNERPYKCDYDQCDKKYRLKKHLDCHKLNHRKERPFKCKECQKGFSTKDFLRLHYYQSHDPEKRKAKSKYVRRKKNNEEEDDNIQMVESEVSAIFITPASANFTEFQPVTVTTTDINIINN